MKKNGFIPEIQGLRALAVISVILFHVQFPFLSGGFVGVDIFFVISGFVITLIIKKEMLNKNFSMRTFFVRRLWRIFPALLATVLITTLIFLPFLPSSVDENFLKSGIASTFGIANIYFYFTLDYFSSGISNPLLHIWSLGVEEQFYLLFPLLLVASNFYRKNTVYTLGVVFILSLTASIITTFSNQSAAFYLPWYRAWEFCGGALIAWSGFQCRAKYKARFLSWFGLISLVGVIFFYSKNFIFPGPGALLPVIGTMCLLVTTGTDTFVNSLLRTRLMTHIGNISYSMYLVHWPLICLAGIFLSIESLSVAGLLIVASYFGGALLYYFVELPVLNYFRKHKSEKSPVFVAFTMPSVAILIVFAMLAWSIAVNNFWLKNPRAFTYLTTKGTPELYRLNECFFVSKKVGIDAAYTDCITSKSEVPNILVTGDSLSANITSSLIKAMPDFNFLQASGVNYKPGRPQKWSENAALLNEYVESEIWQKETLPEVVIYFAMWETGDLQHLVDEVNKVKALGSKVIVIGPPVDYLTSVPILQGISEVIGYDLVVKLNRKNRKEMDSKFKEELIGVSDGYLSLYQTFCPHEKCVHMGDKKGYYVDKVHLSYEGVNVFIPELTDMIRRLSDG
ncbi:MAG: acyltransferase family protein [Pseudomonadota bacterium]|nr:acyltransferase family protein [Pseudomonadota bacterium]